MSWRQVICFCFLLTVHNLQQDGKILAAGYSKYIQLLKSSDLSQIQILEGHTNNVRRLLSNQMEIYSEDATIILWSMDSFQKQMHKTLTVETIIIYFSYNGQTLLSLGEDKLILAAWDMMESKQLIRIQLEDWNKQQYAFSSDGKLFAQSIKNKIHIWNLTTGREATALVGSLNNIKQMIFYPEGKILASISASEDQIKLWDAKILKNESPFDGHHRQLS